MALHPETCKSFRDLINGMSDQEFQMFLNNSLKASGKKCIRVERENHHYEMNSWTLYFSDIEIDTKKETKLFIDDWK